MSTPVISTDSLKVEEKSPKILLTIDVDDISLDNIDGSALAQAVRQVREERRLSALQSAHSSHSSFNNSL